MTGDARTNHRGTGEQWLERIAERCRRGTGEPRATGRMEHVRLGARPLRADCDATFEVRNLRQLVAAVEQLF